MAPPDIQREISQLVSRVAAEAYEGLQSQVLDVVEKSVRRKLADDFETFSGKPFSCGHLSVIPEEPRVEWRGHTVHLTRTELALVTELAMRPGILKNRDRLMYVAYPDGREVDDRTIDSHIKRTRKKFKAVDPDFEQIETLYSFGYRWRK